MSSLAHDLRYALRLLGRSPGFTVTALVTLALGIGANTAMFAVLNAVLLKPLPFRDADRLMLVSLTVAAPEDPQVLRDLVWSYPKYQTFLSNQEVFDSTALFSGRDILLSGDADAERVRGEVITEQYPGVLGIEPLLGRAFTQDEAQKAGAPAVALISHALWTRRLGADPAMLGRTIQINATPHTIVGVLPPGFTGLSGNAHVWLPLAVLEPSQIQPDAAQSHSYQLIARRKLDVPEPTAMAAVRVAGARVDEAYPDTPQRTTRSARAASLDASRTDADIRRGSIVLLAAVGCVLLIACVNLANLGGARALSRGREVAVRVAMGASRAQIVRQCVAEGALLAGAGALAGVIIAIALLRVAAILLPEADVFFASSVAPGTPRTTGAAGLTRIGASMIDLDAMTLLFTAGVGTVTAILVSLLPAWRVSAVHPVEMLKATGRSMSERGLHGFGARAVLVTAQIAFALVLLAGAGLMIRSATHLYNTSIGVTADRLMTVRVDLPRAQYPNDRAQQFFAQLVERTRAIPGVEAAGLGNCPPVSGGCNTTILWFPPAKPLAGGNYPGVGIHWITPGYLPALGMRLLSGRNFTDQDRAGQPRVVLVNEAAVRKLWPNESPLGKQIAVGQGGFGAGAEVVGVVSDVRYTAIETAATPDVYVPLLQSFQGRVRLFVRSALPPEPLVASIAREVRTLDPNLPLSEVKTMGQRVDDAMWRTRIGAWLLSLFGALALLLTAIGIFGVMAQTVMQRTPEIGIRMALGAQRRDVLALMLRRAAIVTGTGLVLGVLSALGLTSVIAGLLSGTDARDPVTFLMVAGLLAAVALLACYIPARRATRLDAAVALRSE